MPLSEEEQRILQEIEKNFYDSDPAFAREVGSLRRNPARRIRLSIVGLAVGLVGLIATFTTSVILAFACFLLMVGSAFVLVSSFVALGRGDLRQVSKRTGSLADVLADRRRQMRDRFRRER